VVVPVSAGLVPVVDHSVGASPLTGLLVLRSLVVDRCSSGTPVLSRGL
jgi:hypothetical protein